MNGFVRSPAVLIVTLITLPRHALETGRVPRSFPVLAIFSMVLTAGCASMVQTDVHVSTDSTTYAEGTPIRLALEIQNRGSEPIILQFSTAQRFDFEMRDSDGNTIWRWSDEMGFAQVLGTEILQPGESLHYEAEFSGALNSDTYEVVGILTTSSGGLTGRASFVIR